MEVSRVSIAGFAGPRLIAALAFLFMGGCSLTVHYLNPQGVGTVRTVGNPCPYVYRRMEIKSTTDPDLRISVSAFWKGEYRLTSTTLFVVISDRELFGYQVGQFDSPPLRRPRRIVFPSDANVTIQDPKLGILVEKLGDTADVGLIQNTLILSVPVPDDVADEFSVAFPAIEIDGEKFQLGLVTFTRTSETLYLPTC
jgi:hypothetical protein